MDIKSYNFFSSGGGFYHLVAELDDGSFALANFCGDPFMGDYWIDWSCVFDADPMTEEEDGPVGFWADWQDEHLVRDLTDDDVKSMLEKIGGYKDVR